MPRATSVPEGLHDPMPVEQVTVPGRGSHIEPPLDNHWSSLDQLRWKAGVVEQDCGVRVQIFVSHVNRTQHGDQLYGYVTASFGGGDMTPGQMWDWFNGVTVGARAHRSAE